MARVIEHSDDNNDGLPRGRAAVLKTRLSYVSAEAGTVERAVRPSDANAY